MDYDNNYMDNTNVSYNRGRRGSSANVVVYSDGRSSSSNAEMPRESETTTKQENPEQY